jgi:DnaK suppressor protein
MTKIETNRFRQMLKNKRDELEHGNRGRGALAIESSADELDQIQHSQERDFAMGTLDRNSKLLAEVRAALSRMEAGRFGICAECEQDISMKRLAAVPWTASCIVCQEAADNMSGQPWNMAEEPLESAA